MTPKKQLFNHLNSFFDRIYLITLKKSKKRHVLMKKLLDGLKYEICWGIAGDLLSEQELEEKYDDRLAKLQNPSKKGLKAGEIGCALSHVKIYKDILSKGYKNALILEDDLILEMSNAPYLPEALNELPSDWELLYFGYLLNNNHLTIPIQLRIHVVYPLLTMLGFRKYNADQLRCKFPRPYSKHLELSGYHYGTHAYGVTASGAEKLLVEQTPVSMAPDNAIGMMCMRESVKAFRLKRQLFHQNKDLDTTITDRYELKSQADRTYPAKKSIWNWNIE